MEISPHSSSFFICPVIDSPKIFYKNVNKFLRVNHILIIGISYYVVNILLHMILSFIEINFKSN